MQKTKDGEVKMVTLMLFGDAEHCQKVSSLRPGTMCTSALWWHGSVTSSSVLVSSAVKSS